MCTYQASLENLFRIRQSKRGVRSIGLHGSYGPRYHRPPAGMPHLQAYTERSKHLNFNGKSLVLADAVDVQSKDIGFPHRWPLKAGICGDRHFFAWKTSTGSTKPFSLRCFHAGSSDLLCDTAVWGLWAGRVQLLICQLNVM